MKRTISVLFTILLAVMTGCGGSSKPPGFPKLVPCKIKVIQGGAPLAGADVVLVSAAPSGTVWSVGGQTDTTGIAVMRTHGEHIGAPVDQYKVVVSKVEVEVIRPESIRGSMYQGAEEKIYDIVAPALGFPKTTTLQINVVKGTVDYSVDVGAAVRTLKKQP